MRLLLLNRLAGYDFALEAAIRRYVTEILSFPTGRYWTERRLERNAWSAILRGIAREKSDRDEDTSSICNDIVTAHEDFFGITSDPASYQDHPRTRRQPWASALIS